MARGINKVILIGNLGTDPETRYSQTGSAITNVTLATSDSWRDKGTGEQVERTEWHRVVFFNRLAEIAGEYLRKGSKVYVEGRLQTRQWEQDGVKRYTTEIVANEMQMLDGRGQAGDFQGPPQQSMRSSQPQQGGGSPYQSSQPSQPNQFHNQGANPQPMPSSGPDQGFDDFDDDIPF